MFSSTACTGEVYRFRPAKALLNEYNELSRQTLYLALPEQLNDPAEDTVNVVWQGDEIIWPNFLNYYLRCVVGSIVSGTLVLPGWHQPAVFEDEGMRGVTEGIALALAHTQQEAYDSVLSELLANSESLSSYTLTALLQRITPRASNEALLRLGPLNQYASVENVLPRGFVHQFSKRILSSWASVSFTKDFANPYLWSAYADEHAGVCLIFDKESIQKLCERQYSEYTLELAEISYETTKPEVEFFSEIPFLNVAEYQRLYTRGEEQSLKLVSDDEAASETRWRRRRDLLKSSLLTKQKYWEAEQEIRLYCTTALTPPDFYSNPDVRTIQHPITSLKAIIFGSRMSKADMNAIREVMIAKHTASPLPDGFDFYIAEQTRDGSIRKGLDSVNWRQEYRYPLKGGEVRS